MSWYDEPDYRRKGRDDYERRGYMDRDRYDWEYGSRRTYEDAYRDAEHRDYDERLEREEADERRAANRRAEERAAEDAYYRVPEREQAAQMEAEYYEAQRRDYLAECAGAMGEALLVMVHAGWGAA